MNHHFAGTFGGARASNASLMFLRRFPPVGAALAAACVLFPATASAGDEFVSPVRIGFMANHRIAAGLVGLGLGAAKERVGFEAFGRAVMSKELTLGIGGARGNYAFVAKNQFHFGVDAGASVGAGRFHAGKSGVLVAAEPGLFARFITKKAGAIHLDLHWWQPFVYRHKDLYGAAMLSIGWSPFFEN